ncbi:MAG: tetratricopeptide repeat protein [Halanaerobiales bacterium]
MAQNEYMEVKDILTSSIELKKQNKFREAKNKLQSALSEYPDNRYLKSSLADTLTRIGEMEEALKLADEVLNQKPGDSRALIVKGNVNFYKREYKKALEFYEQAEVNNDSDYLSSRLIRTELKLKEYQEALELCQKKLDEDPDNTSFQKLMGSIYEKMGKNEKAAQYYDKYLNKKPEDEFAYKEKLKLKMKNKDPEKAVQELKTMLKIGDKGDNVFLHHLLAEKLEKIDKYQEAFKEYMKSLEIEPGNDFAVKQAGFSLYKMGEYERALDYLQEAFRNDPSDYYIKATLVSIYKKTGLIEEGIEFFKEIINNNQGYNKLWGTVKKLSKELGDKNDEN